MMLTLLALSFLQDPAPQNPPAPQPAPTAPAQQKPAREEDRLEGRIAGGEQKPAPEAPTPPPAEKPADPNAGWILANGAALIVNEEIVTSLEIRRRAEQLARDPRRPKTDQQQLFNEAITEGARDLLETQGGKDMGFEPRMIEQYVDDYLQREAEDAGSVVKLAQDLKRKDKDSFTRREEVYAHINRLLWEGSMTGKSQGPGGRKWRDSYVRPGRALFNQRESARRQSANRTVILTQLMVDFGNPPSPEARESAEKRIKELRERIENGEDMGQLAELNGAAPGSRGLLKELSVNGLVKNYPELAPFLTSAAPGDLSPVLPFLDNGQLVGYVLIRPEEFKTVQVQVEGFDTPAHQQGWIEGHRERMSRLREQAGLMQLLSAAYVWPPQTFSGPDENP